MLRSMFLILTSVVLASCGERLTAPVVDSIDPTLPPPAVATTAPSADSQPTSPPPTHSPDPTAAPEVQPTQPPAPTDTPAPVGLAFVKMEEIPNGTAMLDPAASEIRFSSDFRISTGPDLYVILSGAGDLTLDYLSFSRVVTNSPIVYLGELQNIVGEQTYAIPPASDLTQFNTVVVWCKTYSVAFAAAPLR